jgi:general stress protein YciG
MAIEDRGFASMDRNKQREIASKGGRAAHKKGAAHEWTREEAQAAGRKGGLARHRRPDDTLTSNDTPASALPSVPSTSESSSIDER